MQYLSFCVWLILLSLVSTRFIHVVANGRISFKDIISRCKSRITMFAIFWDQKSCISDSFNVRIASDFRNHLIHALSFRKKNIKIQGGEVIHPRSYNC